MSDPLKRSIAIVTDTHPLRGGAVAALLSLWLSPLSIDVLTSADISHPGRYLRDDPKLWVLNVGSRSLNDEALFQSVCELRSTRPSIALIAMSDLLDPEEAVSAARSGLQGFIPTCMHTDMVRRAVSFILSGGTYFPRDALLQATQRRRVELAPGERGHLTVRQGNVLEQLRLGRSNKLIGRDLDMSEATVKVHVRQIMRKLGANNRTQAALLGASRQSVDIALVPMAAAITPL